MKNTVKNMKKVAAVCLLAILTLSVLCLVVGAEPAEAAAENAEAQNADTPSEKIINSKAIAAAATIGLVATAGAVSMGVAIFKTVDSIARQPEAESAIRGSMMLGLVFIETAIIYALIVAILIIFVL